MNLRTAVICYFINSAFVYFQTKIKTISCVYKIKKINYVYKNKKDKLCVQE